MISKVRPHRHRFVSRRPASVVRYAGLTLVLVLLFVYLGSPSDALETRIFRGGRRPITGGAAQQHVLDSERPRRPPPSSKNDGGTHPIAQLMREAEAEFDAKLARQSRTVEEAAAEYRKRRGRHPPPGFDVWYQFAVDQDAIVVEDFWDQIYHDLEPFWAVDPRQIRKEAWDFEMTINVRNGTATAESDWFWTQAWLDMIQHIEGYLPDLDIPLNAMDEPRIIVPWEEIDRLITKANKRRGFFDPKDAESGYEMLPAAGEGPDRTAISQPKNWRTNRPYWDLVRRGCPPDSAARKAPVAKDFSGPPDFDPDAAQAEHMRDGFVSNYTLSTLVCHQPDLQRLNGIFIDPMSVRTTQSLFPMFGGSKMGVNNEILLPPAMYWSGGSHGFATEGVGSGPAWADKHDGAFWRGVASGGFVREQNWRGFQRHRLLSMSNGTKIRMLEMGGEEVDHAFPDNFLLPDREVYGIKAQAAGKLADWVGQWANMSFTDLSCLPQEEDGLCHYTSPYFEVAEGVPLSEMYSYKLLPDIDGNSYSGRYLGFLRSSSLPVKATLFREWHDSRLVAWKHFVPMDPRFGDWLAIAEYYLGYRDPRTGMVVVPAHDAEAERIAAAGKDWAERVLRREDMLVYVLRLLLEYARVSDERRDRMGYVGDLVAD